MSDATPLASFQPRWLVDADGRRGMGMSLLCPLCRQERIAVWFKNPVDGGAPISGKEFLWERNGDDFNSLTLRPSIDASVPGAIPCSNPPQPNQFWGSHWHGCITNGEIT